MARALRMTALLMPTSMWLLAAAIVPTLPLQLMMLALAVVTFAGGILLFNLRRRRAWASMGRALGLEASGSGPYPELTGTMRGLRVRVRREEVREGRRRMDRTVIRLPTGDALRLPGLVTDPLVVRDLILPFTSDRLHGGRRDGP